MSELTLDDETKEILRKIQRTLSNMLFLFICITLGTISVSFVIFLATII